MFDEKLNKIHCQGCLEGMKELPDNYADVVITSPPYNAGKSVRGNFYSEYSDDLPMQEYFNFIKDVINECLRVTKHYVFFNFQILRNNKIAYLQIFEHFKENIKEILIWHKKQVQPSIQETCLSSAFEFILVFSSKKSAENRSFERAFFNNKVRGQLNTNVIYGNNAAKEKNNTDNKAIFPQYFVEFFVKKFTQEGDIVLDPFIGSGTTGIVAKKFRRHFIGFEINKDYADEGMKRINFVKEQKSLGEW